MKRKSSCLIMLFGILIFISGKLQAQTAGDYRSVQSGNWNDVANWQIYVSSTGWTAATSKPGSSRNVTVQAGHTITLDGSNSCNNLTVQAGAVLTSAVSAANAYYLRVGGVSGSNVIVQNDGLIGSITGMGDGIILEAAVSAASVIIQGTGTCRVARLRAVSGNLNNFNMTIDQNIVLTVQNAAAFTAYYNNSANAATDNYTITINSGKTVSLLGGSGAFHMSNATSANGGGNYTYHINGTLDLSASTAESYVIPLSSNAASTVTVNINGMLKLGLGGLSSVNSSPSGNADGKVVFNINNGGLVDATATEVLTLGTNFFVTTGTGALKRKVGENNVVFPVGINATGSYNPVILTKSGVADNFTVSIKSTFDNAVPYADKVVKRQWTINPENAGSNATVSLGWLSADQAANFVPTGSVAVIRYNGTSWEETPAALSGTGNVNAPYQALGNTTYTSFGLFSVQNSTSLPLTLTSFRAALKTALKPQVNLNWQTINEVNTKSFIIERSSDAKVFTAIGTVAAKNTAERHGYSFVDDSPFTGVSYYRLRQTDIDGKFTLSDLAYIQNNSLQLSLYPNPVSHSLTVVCPETSGHGEIKIINAQGKLVNNQLVLAGSTSVSTNVSALSPGVYLLVFKTNGKENRTTFIKQ